jgi:hypothetical protein
MQQAFHASLTGARQGQDAGARLDAVALQDGHLQRTLLRHLQRPPVATVGLLALRYELPQRDAVAECVRLPSHLRHGHIGAAPGISFSGLQAHERMC